MSLYDPENPQHLDYLDQMRALSRRVTESMDARDQATGMVEAREASRIGWANRARPWSAR